MIRATRLDGTEILLNAELIEWIEATPDTLVTLVTKTKLMVKESPAVLYDRIVEYRRRAYPVIRPALLETPPPRDPPGSS